MGVVWFLKKGLLLEIQKGVSIISDSFLPSYIAFMGHGAVILIDGIGMLLR